MVLVNCLNMTCQNAGRMWDNAAIKHCRAQYQKKKKKKKNDNVRNGNMSTVAPPGVF